MRRRVIVHAIVPCVAVVALIVHRVGVLVIVVIVAVGALVVAQAAFVATTYLFYKGSRCSVHLGWQQGLRYGLCIVHCDLMSTVTVTVLV